MTTQAPRAAAQMKTNVKVYGIDGEVEYKANEIAAVVVKNGALTVQFVDWSYITYGPAWKWVVREKE